MQLSGEAVGAVVRLIREDEMEIRWRKITLMSLLMVYCASSMYAQGVAASSQKVADSSSVIRLIRDPHTGMRWLLKRDPGNPGGPGRMVLLNGQDESLIESAIARNKVPMVTGKLQPPLIRSGDRLVIEENSAVVEARLEAVALGPAAVGAEFIARLAIGGRVVRAVALGPGRASFVAPARKEK